MSNHPAAPKSLYRLNQFSFNKVLNDDPFTHSIVLLGTFPNTADPTDKIQAIVRIEKTALDSGNPARFFSENGYIQRVELEESTDIVLFTLFLYLIMVDDCCSTHGSLDGSAILANGILKLM